MRIKILIIVFLLLSGSVVYFAYPVFKNRYFQTTNDANDENSSDIIQNTDSELEDSNNDATTDDENIIDDPNTDDSIYIELTSEDCEDNCEQFEDADDKKYCQEYCGLQTESATTDDCEKLADLKKDYCWKNKALTEKNFSFCKNIADKKILESCKNQLTEEVLNGSNAGNE